MQIKVLKRLRDEKKFDSIESLTEQIKKDEEISRGWINQLAEN